MELKPTNEELKLTIIDDSIIYLNDRIENFDIQLLVFLVSDVVQFINKISYSFDNQNWSNPIDLSQLENITDFNELLKIDSNSNYVPSVYISIWLTKYEKNEPNDTLYIKKNVDDTIQKITIEKIEYNSKPPSSPGSLTVSEITTTSGKLSWTASSDNVGVTGYNIYQIGVGLIGTVTTLFFYVTGLSTNTAYTFTIRAVDNAGNESSGNTRGFTTLDDSLTITSSAPTYSYGDWLIPDTAGGRLYFANGQPNEVISLLLVLTSNTTPWSEVNFYEGEIISQHLISQPLNASNTIRNGTITLDANGVANGLYWGIGIPTCSCKVTITGRSSGLPIPSANSASFTITRP